MLPHRVDGRGLDELEPGRPIRLAQPIAEMAEHVIVQFAIADHADQFRLEPLEAYGEARIAVLAVGTAFDPGARIVGAVRVGQGGQVFQHRPVAGKLRNVLGIVCVRPCQQQPLGFELYLKFVVRFHGASFRKE